MTRYEQLLARAAEADVPEEAVRLRREAAAAREDEIHRSLDLLRAVAEELEGPALARFGVQVGAIFGAVLARLRGAPRLEALERAHSTREDDDK